MDVKEKRELVFDSCRLEINRIPRDEVTMLQGHEGSGVPGHEESHAILRKYLTTEEAVEAFGQLLKIVCRFAMDHWFCMLDGIAYPGDRFCPGLVDRETGEDLRDEDDTWVGGFGEYVGLREGY